MRLVSADYDKQALSAQAPTSAVEEAGRARPSSPSGRLLLRMPPGLHGELARAAERDGTSLNGYIIAKLAESVGTPLESAGRGEARREGAERRTLMWLLAANVAGVVLAGIAAVAILLVAEL